MVRITPYTQRTTPDGRSQTPMTPQGRLGHTVSPEALGDLGTAVGRVAEGDLDARRTELALARMRAQDEEEEARVHVARQLAQATAQARDIRRQVREDSADGFTGVTEEVERRWTAVEQDMVKRAPTRSAQRLLSERLIGYRAQYLDEVENERQRARVNWMGQTLTETIDEANAVLVNEPERFDVLTAEIGDAIAGTRALPAEVRRDLDARRLHSMAATAVSALIDRDPRAALEQLRQPERSGAYGALSGEDLARAQNAAQAELERRQREAERQQAMALRRQDIAADEALTRSRDPVAAALSDPRTGLANETMLSSESLGQAAMANNWAVVGTLLSQRDAYMNPPTGPYGLPGPRQPVLAMQEALALRHVLDNMGPSQRRQALEQFAGRAGTSGDMMARLGQQLYGDDPASNFAVGGLMPLGQATRASDGSTAAQAADIILRGASLLREPGGRRGQGEDRQAPFSMPANATLQRWFDENVRDAYARHPQARQMAFETWKAAYAGLSADATGGARDFNDSLGFRALRLATPIHDNPDGETSTIVPLGMTGDRFAAEARQRWRDAYFERTPEAFSREVRDTGWEEFGYRLVSVAPSQQGGSAYLYEVTLLGETVRDTSGNEVVIEVPGR